MSWSALPPDLILSIAELLETGTHIMQFRAVCRTWRSSIPVSLLTSRNFLSALFPYEGMSQSSVLVANSVFLLRSTVNPNFGRPWLISVEELNPGKLFVRAPLSRVVSKHLPIDFLHSLGGSDFQELGRFFTHRRVDRTQDMFTEKRLTEYDNKVVLFVNPCEISPTIDDYTVVELHDHVNHLSITRLRNGDKGKVFFRGRDFDDIVNFRGRIYAIDYNGSVCSMDYDSLMMSSVSEDPLPGGSRSNYKKRLVVSSGELYVILRRCQISDHNAAFKVFKLNEEGRKWEKLEGIGDDRILFVTFDGCFFALAMDFPGWKGNCIVFRRGSFPEYSGIRNFDCKIFNTWKLHYDVAVFHFTDGDCRPIETYPGYSAVIWPHLPWHRLDN